MSLVRVRPQGRSLWTSVGQTPAKTHKDGFREFRDELNEHAYRGPQRDQPMDVGFLADDGAEVLGTLDEGEYVDRDGDFAMTQDAPLYREQELQRAKAQQERLVESIETMGQNAEESTEALREMAKATEKAREENSSMQGALDEAFAGISRGAKRLLDLGCYDLRMREDPVDGAKTATCIDPQTGEVCNRGELTPGTLSEESLWGGLREYVLRQRANRQNSGGPMQSGPVTLDDLLQRELDAMDCDVCTERIPPTTGTGRISTRVSVCDRQTGRVYAWDADEQLVTGPDPGAAAKAIAEVGELAADSILGEAGGKAFRADGTLPGFA